MESEEIKESGNDISLIDIIGILFRRRKMIIAITCLSAGIAVMISIISLLLPPQIGFLPNEYSSKATLIVNEKPSDGLSSLLSSSSIGNLAGISGVSMGKSYGALAAFIAKSDSVIDVIIQKMNLNKRYKVKKSPKTASRNAFLKKYSTAFDQKTSTMTIKFNDIEPEFARDVVNLAVDLLDEKFALIGGNRNLAKKEQLEVKLADVQVELTRIEKEVEKFQLKYGVVPIEKAATEQMQILAKVKSELILKEMEIKTYKELSPIEDPIFRRLKAERDNLSKFLIETEKGFSTYENIMPSQNELPKIAIEYSHLQRSYLVQQKINEILVQQYELTKLALSGEEPIIQILELAEASDRKARPSRAMICLVSTIAGFFCSILIAFVLESIGKMKNDPETMAKIKGEIG